MVTAVTTTFLGKPVLTSLFKNAKNMVSINENMFHDHQLMSSSGNLQSEDLR